VTPYLRRLRLTLLVLLGLGLAGEAGLRVYARLTRRERGIVFDAHLGWRMLPGVTRTGSQWGGARPTTINSLGWRSAEPEATPATGRLRWVALGDSFTFGVGVEQEERYTEQLAALEPRLEALNLGMNAIGTDQELAILEEHGLALAPALVTCLVTEDNDFTDVACRINGYWPKPWYRPEDTGLAAPVLPERGWDIALREGTYVGEALYRLIQPLRPYKTLAPEWETADTAPLVARLLVRMHTRCTERGARFCVLLNATGSRPKQMERVRVELRAAGVPFVELSFAAASPAERTRLLLSDAHWSPAGHAEAATRLQAGLKALGWF
jgi:hypothetical protein